MNGGQPLESDGTVQFSLKQRLLLRTVPPVLATAFRALFGTCRFEVRNQHHFDDAVSRGPTVIAFWHESMAFAAWHYRRTGMSTLASRSYDGEMAARVVNCFGIGAVRGSSSQGGFKALGALSKAVRQCPAVALTLDGPRGPRREAKPGASILAAKADAVIVPNAYAVQPAWRLHSWDRLPIPKPFSRLVCAYGSPIPPPDPGRPGAIREHREQLEKALNALYEEIESEL